MAWAWFESAPSLFLFDFAITYCQLVWRGFQERRDTVHVFSGGRLPIGSLPSFFSAMALGETG